MTTKFLTDVNGSPYIGTTVPLNMSDRNHVSLSGLLKIVEDRKLITDFGACNRNLLKRNAGEYHITVFNVMEWNKGRIHGDVIGELVRTPDFRYLGVGSISDGERTTYFIPVESAILDSIRESYGYEKRHMHITIGFTSKDLFHAPKNVANIYETADVMSQ